MSDLKILKQSGEVDGLPVNAERALPRAGVNRLPEGPFVLLSQAQRRRKVVFPSRLVFVTAAGGVMEPHFEMFAASR